MGDDKPFDYEDQPFAEARRAQGVDVQQREAQYGEIFAEIIWDGIITSNDRLRLDHAAELLGLEAARTQQIERALRAAYEARHRVRVVEPESDEAPTVDRMGFALQQAEARSSHETTSEPSDSRVSVTDLDIRLRPSADGPTPSPEQAMRAAEAAPLAPAAGDAERRGERQRHTIAPLAHGQDPVLEALEGRIRYLEAQNGELMKQLERAQAELAEKNAARSVSRDPAVLHAQFTVEPGDPAPLHEMFRTLRRSADLDRRWRVAHALAYLGAADGDERAFLQTNRQRRPIKPPRQLTPDDWRQFVRHPDEDELPGDIFAVIAPAVLLSQIAAIRGVAKLPAPPTEGRRDPRTDTTPAVRCVAWAAAILGLSTPPVFVEPRHPSLVEIVPGAPSSTRLGERALVSSRTPEELAFAIGRHLCSHRPEHFMASLVASPRELDDIFLAALMLGNPGLPMDAAKKARVEPFARSIEPLLSDADRARLKAHFFRFVELGGKTNLRQWAAGRDLTAATAGLLLANDLGAARAMLADEAPERAGERMRALLGIWTGTRFGDLRRAIGVALVAEPGTRDSSVPG